MTTLHTIIHQHDPDRHVSGGIDGFIRDLVRHGGSGRHFRIIGVTQPGSPRRLGRWEPVDVAPGVTIDFMPVARFTTGMQQRKIPHTVRLVKGLLRYRPSVNTGIVHFHRVETAAICGTFLRGPKRIVFLHGPGREALNHNVESFWRFAPNLYDMAERRALRSADIAYIMHAGKSEMMRATFPTVRHGTNWYDSSVFFPPNIGTTEQCPVIAWTGRFEPPKDPLLAVRVFAELAARGVAFQAWMAGDGTLRRVVADEINARGLNCVHLTGLLGADEIADRLRGSTAFLSTSLWEGIPRAVIEALACGVPVVGTDVGDVRHLVAPDAGIVVDTRDEDVLAASVQEVLTIDDRQGVAASVKHLAATEVITKLFEEIE